MFIVYYFSKMHLTWFFYISGILCSLYLCLEVLFSERKVIQKSNKTNYCWEILQEAFVNRKFLKCQNSQTFLHKSPQKRHKNIFCEYILLWINTSFLHFIEKIRQERRKNKDQLIFCISWAETFANCLVENIWKHRPSQIGPNFMTITKVFACQRLYA